MSKTKRTGITEITIETFKGIGAPVTIPFKPITMLFGANSAGKSTILKSLAYFCEVVRTRRHPDQLNLSGEKVAIGDFRSVVHGHDETRTIRIAVNVQQPESVKSQASGEKKPKTVWDVLDQQFLGSEIESFQIRAAVSGNASAKVEVRLNNDIQPVLWVDEGFIELNRDSEFVRRFFLEKDGGSGDVEFKTTSGEWLDFSKPWIRYDWDFAPWYENDLVVWAEPTCRNAYELCKVLFGALEQHLGSQRYIGPLRTIPERHQRFESIPADSWYSGLAAWRELQKILRGEKPYHPISLSVEDAMDCKVENLAETAKREIGRLDLGYTPALKAIISVEERLPETGNKSVKERMQALLENGGAFSERQELVLRKSEIDVAPCDVGTGVSQALPIAVGAFAEGCRWMIVEQPELHLHPRLQCDLADVFVSNIHRHTDRTFLIETHSEHLILRLLRRIRETSEGKLEDPSLALTPDDVGVFYVEEAKDGIRRSELRIAPDGQFIDEWPGGFFEEDFNEIVGGL